MCDKQKVPLFFFNYYYLLFDLSLLLPACTGVEPLDKDVMKRPPRDTRKPVFTPVMIGSILATAFLMVAGTLSVFYAHLEEGQETRAVTMCFTTFVFFQMVNALNCRSEEKSVFKMGTH